MFGMFTAKIVCDLILESNTEPVNSLWNAWVWKASGTLKVVCLVCLKYQILTWDVLQSKGLVGPNWCCLCKREAENVDHMFDGCIFFQRVLLTVAQYFKLTMRWDSDKLVDNVYNWCSSKNQFVHLPLFMLWECWKMRNMVFLENLWHFSMRVSACIIGIFNDWYKPKKDAEEQGDIKTYFYSWLAHQIF